MTGHRARSQRGCAFVLCTLVAVCGQAIVSRGETAETATTVPFDAAAVGDPPVECTPALTGKGGAVKWAVVEDSTAPSRGKAVAELSGDSTSYRFPLCIYEALAPTNVDVTVRFKPVRGEVDQAAGLVVRLKDADNYYIARANALEGNVRLYSVVDGDRDQFAGEDAEIATGQWQTLGLRIEGDRITVSLNGKRLFSETDDTFAGPGKVGLWTKADTVTYFDNLTITPLPE